MGQFCLNDNIRLENTTSLVVLSAFNFLFIFVFYSGSVGYIAS